MMNKAARIILSVTIFLIVLMWFYAATSKLLAFPEYKQAMHNQPLFEPLRMVLIYTLPWIEIIVASLTLFRKTQLIALTASATMLFAFTIYIALGLLNALQWVPCSCGGILQHMTWQNHLVFNFLYLSLNLIAIYLTKKERKICDHQDHQISAV